MTGPEARAIRLHEDPELFREAVTFTAAASGFSIRLIEKDYFCSVVLEYLGKQPGNLLVFKGGTCLAKIHAGFYRLSEDMEFAIPMALEARRGDRRRKAIGTKKAIAALPAHLPCFTQREAFQGRNESKQYIGSLSYRSLVTGQEESIKLEVSLREPLLMPVEKSVARTVLLDPLSGEPMVPMVHIPAIAMLEAMAEKLRAALTRREAAIRDLYDLHYALRHHKLHLDDQALIGLVRAKLAVPGNDALNIGPERLTELRGQSTARLRPVLRERDYVAFDLERTFELIVKLGKALED